MKMCSSLWSLYCRARRNYAVYQPRTVWSRMNMPIWLRFDGLLSIPFSNTAQCIFMYLCRTTWSVFKCLKSLHVNSCVRSTCFKYLLKEPACQFERRKRCEFYPWVRKISGGGLGNPLQYSCLENPRQRSLAGYSPWDRKESHTPEAI